MDDDQPRQAPDNSENTPSGASQGVTALAYLISGIGFWGGVGWAFDSWLDLGGIGIAIGSVIGAACGVYLIARRLGV
ncbi:MAG: AtpZ/AtpI family protein [Stackebrandtia sp.]